MRKTATGKAGAAVIPATFTLRRRAARRVLTDSVEEHLAVLPKLGLADAVHQTHLAHISGLEPDHVDQRLIGKDDVGRDAPFLGEFGPALAQRLEQFRIAHGAIGKRRNSGGGTCSLAAGLERVLAQRDFVGALEHAAAGFADRPGAVACDIERDDTGAVELAKDRTPFLRAVFL